MPRAARSPESRARAPGVTRARLVLPALRGRRGSFAHERPKIDAALAAGVGGFILFGGTRPSVTALTRALRRQAGRPLLLGADLERGAAQQVRGLTELPPPGALGFLDDLDATRAAGMITATEAHAAGLNWTFAPVCDLDVEPRNPIVQTGSSPAPSTTPGTAAPPPTRTKGCPSSARRPWSFSRWTVFPSRRRSAPAWGA